MGKKGLNTRILRKISENVQFRTIKLDNDKNEYVVERRSLETGEWEVISRSIKFEKSLMKKHNAWYAQLARMNLTGKLLNRRKNGKGNFLQLLKKK